MVALRAGSQRLRASTLIIQINRCHHPAGCSRFCLPPSSDNLEDQSSTALSLIVRRSLSEKHLTRRANHRQIVIIARIDKARAEKSAAGFLFEVFVSDVPIGWPCTKYPEIVNVR
jgi:hypothetical protein